MRPPTNRRRGAGSSTTILRTEATALTYLRLRGDSQRPDDQTSETIPLEDALGALVDLRAEGKVRHIGLSGASPDMLARALAITPIAAVQNRFNLIDRSGVEVLHACERDNIAFVPFWPLARGGIDRVEALTAPAERLGVSRPTVALAWLLRRSPVIVPIPGTRSPAHLHHNIGALQLAPSLSEVEVGDLTRVEDEAAASLGVLPDRMRALLT